MNGVTERIKFRQNAESVKNRKSTSGFKGVRSPLLACEIINRLRVKQTHPRARKYAVTPLNCYDSKGNKMYNAMTARFLCALKMFIYLVFFLLFYDFKSSNYINPFTAIDAPVRLCILKINKHYYQQCDNVIC